MQNGVRSIFIISTSRGPLINCSRNQIFRYSFKNQYVQLALTGFDMPTTCTGGPSKLTRVVFIVLHFLKLKEAFKEFECDMFRTRSLPYNPPFLYGFCQKEVPLGPMNFG